MHLILVLVGAVLAFAGALLVLYAVPVIDAAAAALFTSGIFAIVGALILFGLAMVARGIDRIAERLEVQPLSAPSVPPVATVTRDEITPRPLRVEPTTASAPPPEPAARAAPKGPSVLSSWLNRASPAAGKRPPPIPQVASEPPAVQVDIAPPARIPDKFPDEPPPPPPPLIAPAPVEPAITAPPIAAPPPPPPPPPLAAAPAPAAPIIPRAVAPAPPPPAPPVPPAPMIPRAVTPAPRPVLPPAPASAATTVYKSGVIDGMAYTLFMDGAIEAELPQGRVRFATVDELQKYLASRG